MATLIRVCQLAFVMRLVAACGEDTTAPAGMTSLPEAITKETTTTETATPDPSTVISKPKPTVTKPILAITDVGPFAAGKAATLDAKITGADKVLWSQISGPGVVSFGSTTSIIPTVSATVEGSYVLNVVATDAEGKSVSANLDFVWDKVPPTISAINNILTHTPEFLQPTVTGATHYAWTKVFGSGTLTMGTPNNSSTTVSASEDGAYVIRLTASDDAGNTAIRNVNLVWDTTAPSISAVADVYTQASGYLAPTITGAATYAWSKVSGPGPVTFSQPNQTATTASASVEGTYVLRMTAQDTAGNTATSLVNFIRDTLPPQITAMSNVLARMSVPVTTTVMGGATYSWKKKSGPGTISFTNPNGLLTNVAATQEGDYVLTLTSTDLAANTASADVNFTWDTTAPTINPVNDILTRVAVTLAPTVTGANTYSWTKISGPGTVNFTSPSTLSTDVSTTADGTYVFRLTASDTAGNVTTRDLNLIWDTTAPVITNLVDATSKSTVTFTPTVTGSSTYAWTTISGPGTISFGTPTAFSTTVTATVDGTYQLRLTATDDAGNSSSRDVSFIFDTVAPVITPVSSILTNTFVSLSPTVSGSPTRFAWTQKSGPGSIIFTAPFAQTSNVSASAEGTYVITFTATDAAGNASPLDISFVWDTIAPVATLAGKPALFTPSSAYSITVGSASPDVTLYKYVVIPSVALCSAATYSSAIAIATPLAGSVGGEGTYNVCVVTGDPAGNWQAASAATSYLWTVDSTAPTITLVATVDANASKIISPTVVGASSYLWTKTSGTGTITFGTPTTASTSVIASQEGPFTLQLQATDQAGNIATATTLFTWDLTLPIISAMADVATNIPITLSPTVSGATSYSWSKFSGTGTVTFGSATSNSTLVTIGSDGLFVLKLTATDAATNVATAYVNVKRDITAPVIGTMTAIATRTSATITPTVTETLSTPVTYAWTTISGPGTINFGTPSSSATTASATVDGAYVLRLTATDAVGNAAFKDVNFTWDTTGPSISSLPSTIYAKAQYSLAPVVTGATTYAWTQTAGAGTITFTSTTISNPKVTYSVQGTATIQLVATDAVGNSTTASAQFVWDTVAPTAPVLAGPSGTATGPITVTATFNETVQGLTAAKITMVKGTVTDVSPSSTTPTTSYTISVTPTGTPMTLTIAVNGAQDFAGNNSPVSATYTTAFDGVAPVAPEAAAPTASVLVDGVGYNTALAKWYWASDAITAQTAIKYYISYSTSSSFDTATQVLGGTATTGILQSSFAAANGCAVNPSTGTSQLCSYTLTGLTAATTYYVNVVAEDAAGNRSVYNKGNFTTLGLQPIFKKVASGSNGNTSCGLTDTGVIYCWGDNTLGTLGDATQISKNIPTAIDSTSKFVDIAVGANHACAIRDNGNLYCWGGGASGQIGNGANSTVLSPTLIGTTSDIYVSIGAGDQFTCGLKDDGKAYCWGYNQNNELGNTGSTNTNAPAAISGTNLFRRLSVGNSHSCGIKDDGSISCWGLNFNGQLGVNSSGAGNNKSTATQVSGTTKFRELALGRSTSCAIAGNGDVYCWGKGTSGQIGNSASADVAVPTKISGTDKFVSLAVDSNAVCGIKDDGSLKCWGDNSNGELNTASAQASSNSPLSSTDSNRYVSIHAGNSMFCGVRSSGATVCWGDNSNGQLGVGDGLSRTSSQLVSMSNVTTPTLVKFKKVVVGDISSCAISSSNDLWCWGASTNGELGVGAKIAIKSGPVHVGTLKWVDIALAYNHVCGITDAYEAYCWGLNTSYEVGTATADVTNKYSPTKVNGSRKYMSIAASGKSSCGIATDGQLLCWGTDLGSTSGNLANGSTTPSQIPTASNDITNQYMKVSGGDNFFCGLAADGVIHCWGKGTNGALGTLGTGNQTSPATSNFDSSAKYIAISTGAGFSCGINAARTAKCFGLGTSGQMGNNASASSTTGVSPTWTPSTKKIQGQAWSGAATDHNCVTTTDYYSYCWGANAQKQSNNSATANIIVPTMENSNIIATSTGTTVSCQLSSQGDISCFGFCDNGRCGQATPGTTDTQAATGAPVALKVSGI